MALLPGADVTEFTVETRQASPANFQMKIKSFSLLYKYGIGMYESRAFEAGGCKWKLIIYPGGGGYLGSDRHVSVYMAVADTSSLPDDWEVNAMFTFFLFNYYSDDYLCFRGQACRFQAMSTNWGYQNMISKETLMDPRNGYLLNDNCVFGAEVFVIKNQQVIECLSLLDNVIPYEREWKIPDFSKLERVWTSPEFSTGRHRWRIDLFPKGDGITDDRYVSMYLVSVNPESCAPNYQTVKVDGCFRIKNYLHPTRRHRSQNLSVWQKPRERWGFDQIMKNEEVLDLTKGFLINDCCLLQAQISVLAIGEDNNASAH